ncbi:hypothetical protein ACWDSJ_10495 [Nocardia sp. NPDC003482]
MRFDRLLTDAQCDSDFRIRGGLRQQNQDLMFARGERGEFGCGREWFDAVRQPLDQAAGQ